MTDQTIKYVGASGGSVILQGDGRGYVDISQLYEFSWQYETINSVSGYGGSVAAFRRDPRLLDLEVRLRGFTHEDFYRHMNELHAVSEADIIANTPGRLYVGDQYATCFLATAGSVSGLARSGRWATETLGVLFTRPYWCTEREYRYNPSDTAVEDTTGKTYNGRYAYRYGSGLSVNTITNTHFAECPAIITVYGPTSNPLIQIAGNTYNVDVVLLSTERLVIDQVTKEIYIVDLNGRKTNAFNARNKAYDIFKAIPSGSQVLSYSGEFLMTVTLIEQRSQLKWTD